MVRISDEEENERCLGYENARDGQPGMSHDDLPKSVSRFVRSTNGETDRLDDVPHEPAWIPVWLKGLGNARDVGAAEHQVEISGSRRRDLRPPLSKAVGALVRAKLGRAPIRAVVDRELNFFHAAIAAERDTAHGNGRARADLVAVLQICREGARQHSVYRHSLISFLVRLHTGIRSVGDA